MKQTSQLSFAQLLVQPITVRRTFRVCLIVGTVLILINQGHLFLSGKFPPLWQVILTYMVPYCVSSYSTAALLSDFKND